MRGQPTGLPCAAPFSSAALASGYAPSVSETVLARVSREGCLSGRCLRPVALWRSARGNCAARCQFLLAVYGVRTRDPWRYGRPGWASHRPSCAQACNAVDSGARTQQLPSSTSKAGVMTTEWKRAADMRCNCQRAPTARSSPARATAFRQGSRPFGVGVAHMYRHTAPAYSLLHCKFPCPAQNVQGSGAVAAGAPHVTRCMTCNTCCQHLRTLP